MRSAQPAERTTGRDNSPAVSSDKLMLKGRWRASKLMGLDVYNEANEKLGDVNELILDKDGKVSAVVTSVGGLGMGEHDIAVTMDKQIHRGAVRTSSTAPATTTRETTTGTSTAPANTTTTTTTTTARTANANDWIPDHAVMSGTKEQLKALPQFKYSDYN